MSQTVQTVQIEAGLPRARIVCHGLDEASVCVVVAGRERWARLRELVEWSAKHGTTKRDTCTVDGITYHVEWK